MRWAAKKSDSSVVYGAFAMAKPRSHLLSESSAPAGISRRRRNLSPMRCAGSAQEIPGGDVELRAEPFIEDQRLDLFL